MTITLQELIAGVAARETAGDPARPIGGLAYDSRQVDPGFAFAAVRGFHVDGHAFIPQALAAGAAAVIYDRTDWRDGNGRSAAELCAARGAAAVLVADSRVALSPLAAALRGYPARRLKVIGVTGSKGKTTTTTLISAVLDGGGRANGLITTVDFKIGDRWWSNTTRQTTPEAPEIQALLGEMAEAGCEFAVVESSSHGLSPRWNRLGDCEYDVAVLTNITHEHLDYHGSFEQYRDDKAELFRLLAASAAEKTVNGQAARPVKTAIANLDDPSAEYVLARAGGATRLTYAVDNPAADVRAVAIDARSDGTRVSVTTPWGPVDLNLRLLGAFNVPNALAALCVGLSQGVPAERCKAALEAVTGVSGRMERIDQGQPFTVLVDYAHNPDSFEKLFSVMRPVAARQLIAVFGSAGERDIQKRAIQGRLAAQACDFVVITDEDPRLEDRHAILDQIAEGALAAGKTEGPDFAKIADRRDGIRAALAKAGPGDIVLLLGKGHESCIIYGDHTLPWDEREVARELLAELGFQSA